MNKRINIGVFLSLLFCLQLQAGDGIVNWQHLNPKHWVEFVQAKVVTQPDSTRMLDGLMGDTLTGKRAERVEAYMLDQAKRFNRIDDATVSLVRNGQVLKVNVPMDAFFYPNDSVVVGGDENKSLCSVLTFLNKGYTDLVVCVHWDDQGTLPYKQMITGSRLEAIVSWLQAEKVNEQLLGQFNYLDQQPLFDNDTMENRRRNRRVTFYFLPNKQMLKKARWSQVK